MSDALPETALAPRVSFDHNCYRSRDMGVCVVTFPYVRVGDRDPYLDWNRPAFATCGGPVRTVVLDDAA